MRVLEELWLQQTLQQNTILVRESPPAILAMSIIVLIQAWDLLLESRAHQTFSRSRVRPITLQLESTKAQKL